jgi:hypothetical protein
MNKEQQTLCFQTAEMIAEKQDTDYLDFPLCENYYRYDWVKSAKNLPCHFCGGCPVAQKYNKHYCPEYLSKAQFYIDVVTLAHTPRNQQGCPEHKSKI